MIVSVNTTKKNTHPITFQEKFQKLKEKYPNYIHIFTNNLNKTMQQPVQSSSIEKFKFKNISQEKPQFSALRSMQ